MLAAYGYAVQIYCDFSAYTDMAIGLAALLGYRFPINFNQPYRAQSLREFWQRWHISLSSWLRDYLYKPLGGSRGSRWFTARNLMITMLLGGIWHGAAWKFVAWGGLHGAGLVIERWLQAWSGAWARTPLGRAVAVLIVFHIVCLGWILFRADSFATVVIYLTTLVRDQDAEMQATPFTLALIVLGLALHAVPRDLPGRLARLIGDHPAWMWGVTAGVRHRDDRRARSRRRRTVHLLSVLTVTPGVTPRQLLGIAVLGCIVAATLGAAPLASWVDASIAGGTVVQQAADALARVDAARRARSSLRCAAPGDARRRSARD